MSDIETTADTGVSALFRAGAIALALCALSDGFQRAGDSLHAAAYAHAADTFCRYTLLPAAALLLAAVVLAVVWAL